MIIHYSNRATYIKGLTKAEKRSILSFVKHAISLWGCSSQSLAGKQITAGSGTTILIRFEATDSCRKVRMFALDPKGKRAVGMLSTEY